MMNIEFNNYEQFEQLLQHKAYGELDEREMLLVNAFITDEVEYRQLRKVLLIQEREATKTLKVPVELLATLQEQMPAEKAYRIPAWAASFLLICCSAFAYWAGQREATQIVREVHTIENYLPSDTVFLTSRPDTVYVEQVKYIVKKVPIWANTAATKDSLRSPKKTPSRGTSWEDTETLQDLIVTGD